jgi:hypothetical protein
MIFIHAGKRPGGLGKLRDALRIRWVGMHQHPDLIVARVLLISTAGRHRGASRGLDRLHRSGPQVLGDGREADDT